MALKYALLAAIITTRALQVVAEGPKTASAWYAGFHSADFPPSKVNWSKYTHMTYAFAEMTQGEILDLGGSNPDDLPKFVAAAHEHRVKALVSVGGWTGSRGFSLSVGSSSNRTVFVKAVTDFAQKYKLDGIDFDWEYPAKQGIGCNAVNTQDTGNFLLFLQELRESHVGSKLILTAAVSTSPFVGPNGTPLTDVSGFSKVLDWVEIMNYDIWGPWTSTLGPNAPLDDTCATPQNQVASAVSAIKKWTSAGIPRYQIVLGVPAYGHSYRVSKTDAFEAGSTAVLAQYPPFSATDHPAGDSWDDAAGLDVCGNHRSAGGDITFWGMIEYGYLSPDGSIRPDIFYRYDSCSQTPFVYNLTTEIMVSFDNAKSFGAKGKFIQDQSLLGFAIWEAGGDSGDILLNSIRMAAGFCT